MRRKRARCLALAFCGALAATSAQRGLWMKNRSQEWWDEDVNGRFTEMEFLQNFRMSKATFNYICQRLSTRLERQDTNMRRPIPLAKRVGVALYWLATGSCYRTLANLFGIANSSICGIIHDFCQAVREVLMPEYIKLPQGDDLREVIDGFRQRWGFPQCAGAIDGSHIPIIAPEKNPSDYFNRKGWHSVIPQGIVDHRFW